MSPFLRAALLLASSAISLTLQASCARSVSSDVDSDPLLDAPRTQNPTPLTVFVPNECPKP
jgi:hypothetical protein